LDKHWLMSLTETGPFKDKSVTRVTQTTETRGNRRYRLNLFRT
jgi:hypothetical protein